MRRICACCILLSMGIAFAQEQEGDIQRVELGEGEPAFQPFWVQASYLLWWVKNDHTPGPLLTTGRVGEPSSAAIGQAGTEVYFGDQLNYRNNSGGRLKVGWWLGNDESIGVEFTGFVLETHTIHGEANSNRTDGTPVLARPFFNTLTGQEDAAIITGPRDRLGGRYLGGIDIFADSRTWGGELNTLFELDSTDARRLHLLTGIRYLGQKDQLRFSQSSTVLSPGTVGFGGAGAPPPSIVSIQDYLETTNHFRGAQIGARGEWEFGRWIFDLSGKVGLGANFHHTENNGYTLLTGPDGGTNALRGGLYVPAHWVGQKDAVSLSFISEVDVSVGFRILPRLLVRAGYTFLYWDHVARPGAQVSRHIDPRLVPSHLSYQPDAAAKTPFNIHTSDFWAQGLNVGLEFRF